MRSRSTRRDFMRSWAAAGAGAWAAMRSARAIQPAPAGDRLRIAQIGCANQGASDLNGVRREQVVALCDVDEELAARTYMRNPHPERFTDYRRLLDKLHKQIDAVMISTPDHMHAPIALAAMQSGKHVFCQKPLTRTIGEARRLAEAARKSGVVTQMGNQGHSNPQARQAVEILRAGAIGAVREVWCWTNRPGFGFTQMSARPAETPPVPKGLHWNLWLGVAPQRPYHPTYHPGNWRGWWDFGTGALGDMGCHIMDAAFWALDLRHPVSVECVSPDRPAETPPSSCRITWEFPARGSLPPCTLRWLDAGQLPPRELFDGRDIVPNGSLLIGEKGRLYFDDAYCGNFVLLPERDFADYQPPAPGLPRPAERATHYSVWVDQCKQGRGSVDLLSDFDYAAGLTEMLLLGNVAARTGGKIEWDHQQMRVTNRPEANAYIDPPYRQGW